MNSRATAVVGTTLFWLSHGCGHDHPPPITLFLSLVARVYKGSHSSEYEYHQGLGPLIFSIVTKKYLVRITKQLPRQSFLDDSRGAATRTLTVDSCPLEPTPYNNGNYYS